MREPTKGAMEAAEITMHAVRGWEVIYGRKTQESVAWVIHNLMVRPILAQIDKLIDQEEEKAKECCGYVDTGRIPPPAHCPAEYDHAIDILETLRAFILADKEPTKENE